MESFRSKTFFENFFVLIVYIVDCGIVFGIVLRSQDVTHITVLNDRKYICHIVLQHRSKCKSKCRFVIKLASQFQMSFYKQVKDRKK